MKYNVGDVIVDIKSGNVWYVAGVNNDWILTDKNIPHYRIKRDLGNGTIEQSEYKEIVENFFKIMQEPNDIMKEIL